jgi:hypothetical protein
MQTVSLTPTGPCNWSHSVNASQILFALAASAMKGGRSRWKPPCWRSFAYRPTPRILTHLLARRLRQGHNGNAKSTLRRRTSAENAIMSPVPEQERKLSHLTDPALLDRLASEKLKHEAEAARQEVVQKLYWFIIGFIARFLGLIRPLPLSPVPAVPPLRVQVDRTDVGARTAPAPPQTGQMIRLPPITSTAGCK